MQGNQNLYVNVSIDFKNILYIDEDENFMRITYQFQKAWFDSSLTFQNLKRDVMNLIFEEDKDLIWLPWINVREGVQ